MSTLNQCRNRIELLIHKEVNPAEMCHVVMQKILTVVTLDAKVKMATAYQKSGRVLAMIKLMAEECPDHSAHLPNVHVILIGKTCALPLEEFVGWFFTTVVH